MVNEAGLYAAILKSRKAEAKPFKRWVTHEVLPAIRRTGGYFRAPSEHRLEVAASGASAVFTFMRVIGLDQNAAAISANQAAYAVHGVNLLELSGNTRLLSANQEAQALTPTKLGALMGGVSARQVNKLRIPAKHAKFRNLRFAPDLAGRPHGS